MRHLLVALLLAGVTACGDSGGQPATSTKVDVDIRGQWRLTSAEIQGQTFDAPVRSHLTLVVSDAGNQAHGGCTVVWLDPQVSGSSVTLREVERGGMLSCPPTHEQTDFDEPYLDAVADIEHATGSGELLTLTGPDVTLNFVKSG